MAPRASSAGRRVVVALALVLLGSFAATSAMATPAAIVAGESGAVDVEPTAPSETPSPREVVVPTPSESGPPVDGGIAGLAERLWWLWALLGVVVGWLLGRWSGRDRSADASRPVPQLRPADPAPTPTPPPPASATPRETDPGLVEDLVLAHDLAPDEATTGHLEQMLARHGVVRVPAEPGTAFDSTLHRAVGTEPMGSPPDDPAIVRVVRPGWRTQTDLVRQPEVIVTPPTTSPPR